MAVKKAQIKLDPPSELVFKDVRKGSSQVKLTITNLSADEAVHFKVKTTAPKRYCVRPNQGKIDASSSVEVMLILQQLGSDEVRTDKADKFLVQAVSAPADRDTKDVFNDVPKDVLTEVKLRCKFQVELLDQVQEEDLESKNSLQSLDPTPSSSTSDKPQLEVLKAENARLTAENLKIKEAMVEAKKHVNTSISQQSASRQAATAAAKNDMLPLLVAAFVLGVLLGWYF
eukprot:comp25720_c0_seq1/m.47023 comp25720_c0_seq1/g.47023  ORF comp25720_c0_seq1/g.47023 comp25720_c0_seq1/m.47023 type:complete len:229 (-) comp25720_c0_seq1:32-718(-)